MNVGIYSNRGYILRLEERRGPGKLWPLEPDIPSSSPSLFPCFSFFISLILNLPFPLDRFLKSYLASTVTEKIK